MAGRPKKKYSFKRNYDSLQFYELGEFCGSVPLKELCEIARNKKKLKAKIAQKA